MKIKKYNLFPAGLGIIWDDESNTFIQYNKLRDACPCAYCAGETDAFGNTYIGQGIRKTELAYEINKIVSVGHYAIRIYWKDNHNSGIYTFELLQNLS